MVALAASLITLSELNYAPEALEPYISAETIYYHHDKHHAGYVAKLNELIKDTRYENMTLEEIIRESDGAIFNNAAQVWNHTFYFDQFSPKPQKEPSGKLLDAINTIFGNVDALKARMTSAATTLFGSGWVWLAADRDKKLYIISKPKAGTPLTEGLTPLVAIDVWEHAYYIDYRNERAAAVKAMWNVVDWKRVEELFNAIK
ncbi:MAG: superoxide dismutase [Alistipes sp.]|nr:superoxide dismutase [Alistipes sp.]MDE7129672.1 superoxide dismutase [Alistipes sp.]